MPIIPKIKVCLTEGNTILNITDTTGSYSAGNLGGYGAPNTANTAVAGATLTMTYGDTSTNYDCTTEVTAASSTGLAEIQIAPVSLGTNLADGVYHFEYSINDGGTVRLTKTSVLFLGQARCCIDKLQVQVANYVCDSCETSEYTKRVDLAESLYNSLLAMGGCYKLGSINKILTKLRNLCDFENCNCN